MKTPFGAGAFSMKGRLMLCKAFRAAAMLSSLQAFNVRFTPL